MAVMFLVILSWENNCVDFMVGRFAHWKQINGHGIGSNEYGVVCINLSQSEVLEANVLNSRFETIVSFFYR